MCYSLDFHHRVIGYQPRRRVLQYSGINVRFGTPSSFARRQFSEAGEVIGRYITKTVARPARGADRRWHLSDQDVNGAREPLFECWEDAEDVLLVRDEIPYWFDGERDYYWNNAAMLQARHEREQVLMDEMEEDYYYSDCPAYGHEDCDVREEIESWLRGNDGVIQNPCDEFQNSGRDDFERNLSQEEREGLESFDLDFSDCWSTATDTVTKHYRLPRRVRVGAQWAAH
jgi:hypothetical protein